jgi:hypothetical protein
MIGHIATTAIWVGPGPTEQGVRAATRSCGVSITIIRMPPKVKPSLGLQGFGIRLPASATSAQRLCIAAKVPLVRVGFISEPPQAGHR